MLLLGLVLWTALGLLGTLLSATRGERWRVQRGLVSIGAAWVVYLAVLLLISWRQPIRVVPAGQEVCFDKMCFAVEGADPLQGFLARGQEPARLLRVRLRLTNKGVGRPQSDERLRAYLVDGQGRRWEEVRGLSGVRLSARVAAGDTVLSEPVFRVSPNATDLRLVLTHGGWQPGVLVIGDPDSWRHQPTEMQLQP